MQTHIKVSQCPFSLTFNRKYLLPYHIDLYLQGHNLQASMSQYVFVPRRNRRKPKCTFLFILDVLSTYVVRNNKIAIIMSTKNKWTWMVKKL